MIIERLASVVLRDHFRRPIVTFRREGQRVWLKTWAHGMEYEVVLEPDEIRSLADYLGELADLPWTEPESTVTNVPSSGHGAGEPTLFGAESTVNHTSNPPAGGSSMGTPGGDLT